MDGGKIDGVVVTMELIKFDTGSTCDCKDVIACVNANEWDVSSSSSSSSSPGGIDRGGGGGGGGGDPGSAVSMSKVPPKLCTATCMDRSIIVYGKANKSFTETEFPIKSNEEGSGDDVDDGAGIVADMSGRLVVVAAVVLVEEVDTAPLEMAGVLVDTTTPESWEAMFTVSMVDDCIGLPISW